MVDIRPLLFINFLLALLLASAGIVHLHDTNAPSISEVPQVAQESVEPELEPGTPEPESSFETDENIVVSDSDDAPIFADQVPSTASTQTPITAPPVATPATPVAISGKLTVRSNVYGDTVLINGKPYGSSALEVELSPGTYTVEVTKGGFQNWRQEIYIAKNSEQTIVAELQQYTTVNYRNGVWEHGVQTGEGRYQDGARIDYQGSFVNGQFHGYGSARYGDGSRYQGEWFEGERKGQGTFVISNGDTYVGQFSGDKFNGDGTQTKANGDIYTGYWIEGELSGQGSLTTRDGLLYVGGFSDNLFHGNGTLTYPDGGTYEGSFSNGLFHGKGVEVYASGKKYEGQFIEGLYHGKGEILNPNGSKISGHLKTENLLEK